MTFRDIVYLCTAAAGATALGFKLRYLSRRWGTPQLWSVIVSVFLASLLWWAAAPTSILLLNRATGIANFTAPLVYCLVVAFGGSTLVLAVFCLYPPAVAWPRVNGIITAYGLAIAAIVVLFSISDLPVERLTDFETYYARQPTAAAFLAIYAISTAVSQGLIAYMCLKSARSKDYAEVPWLRRGIGLYGIAALAGFLVMLEKFLATATNWFGVHWLDTVNVVIPVVFALPGMFATLLALVLPIWGPRLPAVRRWVKRWRAFLVLRPVHQALRPTDPALVLVAPGKRFDPYHRVRRQLTELSDFRWTLEPRFDPTVGETARHLGHRASLSDEDLAAVVEAAQLKAALARGPGAGPAADQPRHSSGTDNGQEAHDDADVDGELARWLRIATVFRRSPIVAQASTRSSNRQRLNTPPVPRV
jgi:hypothetical protein